MKADGHGPHGQLRPCRHAKGARQRVRDDRYESYSDYDEAASEVTDPISSASDAPPSLWVFPT